MISFHVLYSTLFILAIKSDKAFALSLFIKQFFYFQQVFILTNSAQADKTVRSVINPAKLAVNIFIRQRRSGKVKRAAVAEPFCLRVGNRNGRINRKQAVCWQQNALDAAFPAQLAEPVKRHAVAEREAAGFCPA